MKLIITALLSILLYTPYIATGQVHLLAQSPDGRKVMLGWFVKQWNPDITGFDIKRKDGLQGWVKLNKEPIVPGISMKKNLAASGLNRNEESIIKARLFKLLASRKLKETELQAFTNEKTLQDMMDLIAHDHEIALMAGFAYTDHSVTKKTSYEYGLFIQGTDKLLAKIPWNYGEIPDLNTVSEITSKATTKTKGIQLTWNADLDKMKAVDVTGFNIYRQGIRLNDLPVTSVNDKDPSEFIFSDNSANSATPQQYSISAESVFGIEGIIRPYTYDPADHPTEYKPAEVTDVSSLGYYFKEGIQVKWNFPKEYERFIKGFYIEKDNMPAGYSRVSTLLDPAMRSFTDKSPSPVSSYIRVRAIAVYKDRTNEYGAARLYSYFPMTDPPAPQGVTARQGKNDRSNTIQIKWDARMNGDELTDNYRIYVSIPPDDRFTQIHDARPAKTNSYTYPVTSDPGVYKFYITALTKAGGESASSDTVSVQYNKP